MIPFLIIFGCFVLFVFVVKSVLGSTPQQPKQQSRPTPTYSPHTIRDTPKPKPKQKEIIVRTLDIPDDNDEGIYESKIAGITKHCNHSDKGIFHGIIFNEDNNPYNANAMAIVSLKKKIIGYIPENELYNYRDWCNGKPVTCVGFIKTFENDEGKNILFGRVYAIKPCNSKFVDESTKELLDMIEEEQYLSMSRV